MSDEKDLQKEPVAEISEEQRRAKAKADFVAHLKKTYGDSAPTEAILDKWRVETGRLRWVELAPNEIYFYRGCRALEYREMINSLDDVRNKDPYKFEELLREKLVTKCVLFPKIKGEEVGTLFAGTINTLYDRIMSASNFIDQNTIDSVTFEWE